MPAGKVRKNKDERGPSGGDPAEYPLEIGCGEKPDGAAFVAGKTV